MEEVRGSGYGAVPGRVDMTSPGKGVLVVFKHSWYLIVRGRCVLQGGPCEGGGRVKVKGGSGRQTVTSQSDKLKVGVVLSSKHLTF